MATTYVIQATGTLFPVEFPELKITLTDTTPVDLIAINCTIPLINKALSIQDNLDAGYITLTVNGILTNIANMNTIIASFGSNGVLKAQSPITASLVATIPSNFVATSLTTIYSLTILDNTGVEIQDQLAIVISGNTLAVTSSISLTNIQIMMTGI